MKNLIFFIACLLLQNKKRGKSGKPKIENAFLAMIIYGTLLFSSISLLAMCVFFDTAAVAAIATVLLLIWNG
jgi:hypothetical protein